MRYLFLTFFMVLSIKFSICQTDSNNCTEFYQVKEKDTCNKIRLIHGLNRKLFKRLNPTIDCKNLTSSISVCVANDNLGDGCSSFHRLKPNQKSCDIIVKDLEMSLEAFQAMNPLIDCNETVTVKFVCTEINKPFKCLLMHQVKENETLEMIIEQYSVKIKKILRINPFLREEDIQVGQNICIRPQKDRSQIDDSHDTIEKLSNFDSNLKKDFDNYISSPDSSKRDRLEKRLDRLLKEDKNFRKRLRKMEKEDNMLKGAYKEKGFDRPKMCQIFTSKIGFESVAECFCGDDEPFIHCSRLYSDQLKQMKDLQETIDKKLMSPNLHHNSSEGRLGAKCEFSYDTKSFSIDCCQIYVLEFCIKLAYTHANNDLSNVDPNILAFQSITGSASVCLPFLKEILEKINLDSIYSGCLLSAGLTFYPFKASLSAQLEVTLAMVELSVGAVYQIGKPPSYMCKGLFCEKDYCYLYPKTLYFDGFSVRLNFYFFSIEVLKIGEKKPGCIPYKIGNEVIMEKGKRIKSPNGRYECVLQNDGNLVVYKDGNQATWSTNTYSSTGPANYFLKMKGDGNLVIYDNSVPKWASNTCCDKGINPYSLEINDQGQLLVLDGYGRCFWGHV